MFKFVFVLFITVLCTYLVFSSTSPNSSEHSSNQAGTGHQESSESLLLIQDFFVKSYEYVQHYFTLIFVENQFQEAGEAIYQDFLAIFKHLEEYLRSIDYNSVVKTFEVTDFQLRLIREFSLILLGNSVLVWFAWKFYGPRISAKFGHSKSRKTVEELRLSMSEFQLPKEHDFKFK